MLPLIEPYCPFPALSVSDYSSLQAGIAAFHQKKLSLEEVHDLSVNLEVLGFKNESQWILDTPPKKQQHSLEVTVYVPCYNAGQYLNETLTAILHQTYPVQEIIVIDDGSSDRSMEIASKYTGTIIMHSSNRGLSASRNTALAATKTALIAGIDADTVLDPYWLERLIPYMDDSKTAGAGGRLIERYGTTLADGWRKELMGQHHGQHAKKDVHLFGCNSLIKTEILKNLGGFNERCKTSFDDIEISERILKGGYSTCYDPSAVCYHSKKDTPASIVKNAYRWRVPPFELRGVFLDPKLLAARWVLEVREGISDIHSLFAQGKGWLTYPCFMMVLYSIMIDALRVSLGNLSDSIVQKASSAIFQTIEDAPFFTKAFKEDILKRVHLIIEQFSSSDFDIVEGSEYLKNPRQSLSLLLVSLTELPSVYRFSKEVCAAIEESHACCLVDEASDIYAAHNRSAMIMSDGCFKEHKTQVTEIAERLDTRGVPYRIFFDPLAAWETRATLEELRSLEPESIYWFCTSEELPYARSAKIIASLMCPQAHLELMELI